MAFCTHCGQANRDTANFCGYCGTALRPPPAAPAAPPRPPSPANKAPAAPPMPSRDPWAGGPPDVTYQPPPAAPPAVMRPQPVAARSLDMQCIAHELQRVGWQKAGPGNYMGLDFECVGSRKALGLVQWNVLVTSLPVLDSGTIKEWAARFQQMNKQAQSWVMGKAFILCLVAQEIDPTILGTIQSNNFGLFGVIRMKGGGGMILIGDERNGQVYGDIPRLPRDAHNYMSDTMKALLRCLGGEG